MQHYPDPRAVSGYPLHSDAASYCLHNNDNILVPKPWADMTMKPDVSCAQMAPKGQPHYPPPPPPRGAQEGGLDAALGNRSHFPRAWTASTAGSMRGTAWFFYPRAWCKQAPHLCSSCQCQCGDSACINEYCSGPQVSALQKAGVDLFKDKPWTVFIHGGEFHWNNNIDAAYSQLSSRVAEAANMGVLAVDYRTTASMPLAPFPAALEDVIAALKFLADQGASPVALHGDSSGGTQVVETLIYMEHLKASGVDLGVTVDRALTFSCWLDLTSSTPTFYTRKWCTSDCDGIGDPDNKNSPGWVQIKGQCAALEYAGPSSTHSRPQGRVLTRLCLDGRRLPPQPPAALAAPRR